MSSSNFLIVKVTGERERGNLLCLQNNGSSHYNPPLKERMTARSPSQSTARLASLAVCFCFCFFVFAVSPRFLPFPPAAEPGSRLIHVKLEFLEGKYWTCWWPSSLHHTDKLPLTSKVTYLTLLESPWLFFHQRYEIHQSRIPCAHY